MSTLVASISRARPAFILWRHVVREMLPPTAIGFLVFTFLMLMRWLLQISRLWIEYGAGLVDVLRAVLYSLPHIVVLTLPMGLLVGGLIAFGRMSADFEIVALRALGVSLLNLVPPVLAFSSVLWGITTYLFLVTMPWGNQKLLEMQWEAYSERAFSQEVRPRVFHENFPGLVLYIEDIVDQGREWRGVFAARTETDPPTILRAERAYPIADQQKRATYLILEKGTVISSAEDARNVTIMNFERRDELVWSEDRDSLLGEIGKDGRSMTLPELRAAIAAAQAEGNPAWDLQVEVHKKFALPFACVVLGLISLPLGISTQRQTTAAGFGMGVLVIMLYYVFAQNGEQQADVGAIPPWLGMWAGNIVLGIAALLLLWRKANERELRWWARLRRRLLDRAGRLLAALGRRGRALAGRQRRRSYRGGFPRTLDRYVLWNYCTTYALSFLALVVVITGATWIEKASYVQHPEFIGGYLRYQVWEIVHDVIPVAAVITVLATFSLMSKRAEIVAALAGGVSLARLVAPILLPALALTGAAYALQDTVLPVTTHRAKLIEQQMHPSRTQTLQRLQTWVFSEGKRVFHFADYVDNPPEFRGLRIYYLTDGAGGIARMEYARQAFWRDGRWQGYDGWRRYFVADEDTGGLVPTGLEEFKFALLPVSETPAYFTQSPRQPDQMSIAELRRHVRLLRDKGYDPHRALVDLHLKIAQPAIVLVMTLVGVPFAFRMGRHGALTGVGIAVALAIVYWLAFGVFRALGYAGQLPPTLAAWAPHLLFMALGGYLALGLRS